MAGFNGRFIVELIDREHAQGRGMWKLVAPLVYQSDLTNRHYYIPAGFTTDFASVPRIPVAYWLFGDRVHEAPTLHDWLYQTKHEKRKTADDLFLEAILATSTMSRWQAQMMWAGVRVGGGAHYGDE